MGFIILHRSIIWRSTLYCNESTLSSKHYKPTGFIHSCTAYEWRPVFPLTAWKAEKHLFRNSGDIFQSITWIDWKRLICKASNIFGIKLGCFPRVLAFSLSDTFIACKAASAIANSVPFVALFASSTVTELFSPSGSPIILVCFNWTFRQNLDGFTTSKTLSKIQVGYEKFTVTLLESDDVIFYLSNCATKIPILKVISAISYLLSQTN